MGIFDEKYESETEIFAGANGDFPPVGWRTLSVIPVLKIPRPMKRADRLKRSGEEKLVWVKVTTSGAGWNVSPKESNVWWDSVADNTTGIAIVRDGRVIGVIRLRGPSYCASINLKWNDLGIFTTEDL